MKKPELDGLSVEQLKYVNYLEGCLNGSSELILALNTASRVFAEDLNMLCSDDTVIWTADGDKDLPVSKLTFLSGDAKDKTFDRIMILFDKFDKIKALSQHFKGNEPQKTATKIPVKTGGNVYEHVVNELSNGRTAI